MLPLKIASDIAVGIGYRLMPFCNRLNIAGSIRREKLEVKDIEIVCLPKMVATGQVDLFSNEAVQEAVHGEFVRKVKSLGKVIKGQPEGRYMQIEVPLEQPHNGVRVINLDLFMPQPDDYFRQLAIRTGSAEYSRTMIANKWLKLGWVGTADGLRLEHQCFGSRDKEGKMHWRCMVDNPKLPPVWDSERSFFEWLGVEYLSPKLRFITPSQNVYR